MTIALRCHYKQYSDDDRSQMSLHNYKQHAWFHSCLRGCAYQWLANTLKTKHQDHMVLRVYCNHIEGKKGIHLSYSLLLSSHISTTQTIVAIRSLPTPQCQETRSSCHPKHWTVRSKPCFSAADEDLERLTSSAVLSIFAPFKKGVLSQILEMLGQLFVIKQFQKISRSKFATWGHLWFSVKPTFSDEPLQFGSHSKKSVGF